jgi:hypothetical protein
LGVSVRGSGGHWATVTGNAATVVDALVDPSGPVAFGARNLLWQGAQSRAFSVAGGPRSLVSVEDVIAAVETSVQALAGCVALEPPRPPVMDMGQIVRQSVEGLVQRNLGWVDGYFLGVEGLPLVDVGVRRAIARAASAVALGALEGLSEGGLPIIDEIYLADAVTRGLSVVDELERGLAGNGGTALAASALVSLETIAPNLPDLFRGVIVTGLVDVAGTLARLGLVCARDALLAVAATGCQVNGTDGEMGGGGGGPVVQLEDLSVATTWSGRKATEPPDLLSLEPDGVGLGTLPYTSTCLVAVQGTAMLDVTTGGTTGKPLRASWRAPLDLEWEVTVVTGRPLYGVAYTPSTTLSGDVSRVAEAMWARAEGSLGWLSARFGDAAEMVASWAGSLIVDMKGSLMTESAYTLSQGLWGVGGSLMDNKTGKAINRTWDILVDLFGDDLKEAMTWKLELMGLDLVISIDPMRQKLTVGLSRRWVSLNVTVKRLCDPHPPFPPRPIEGFHWGVFGEARLDHGERQAELYFDPLTLERDSVLTLEVGWGTASDGGRLVVDALEARKLNKGWKVSLADLSGVGMLLSTAGGGLADAGLAVHGAFSDTNETKKVLKRSVKEAWLATMRGWKVGDLMGQTGRGPDAETFLETLMRELHGALVKRGVALLSEVEVFVEVSFPTPGWPSLRLSLVLAEPLEALLPLAVWVRRSLESLLGGAMAGSVDGAADAMSSWLAEHLMVRFDLSWTVNVPDWLASRGIVGMPDTVGLVVRGQVNVAALAAVTGRSRGLWEGSVEVMLRGVPGAMLALVPGMGSTKWKWTEVTLVRATFTEVAAARLLISQVLYDAQDGGPGWVHSPRRFGRVRPPGPAAAAPRGPHARGSQRHRRAQCVGCGARRGTYGAAAGQ